MALRRPARRVSQVSQSLLRRIPVTGASLEPLGILSLNDIALACQSRKTGVKAQEVSHTLAAICRSAAQAVSSAGEAA
jgi:hypothetical protein